MRLAQVYEAITAFRSKRKDGRAVLVSRLGRQKEELVPERPVSGQ